MQARQGIYHMAQSIMAQQSLSMLSEHGRHDNMVDRMDKIISDFVSVVTEFED